MPKALDRCVERLIGKGYPESSALPICRTSLGMSKHGEDEDEYIKRAEKLAEEDYQRKPTTVQSLIFPRAKYGRSEAIKWVKDHDYKSSSVEETEDSFRLQQRSVDDFNQGSFRTIDLGDGIKTVIGHLKGDSFSLETSDLYGVEIFAAGKWNGKKFSVADLDELISAFNETKSMLKPFVKIGHGENQSLLRNDELPAAGWIENLRRQGDKLLADFKRVPNKIKELIASGAYRTRSVEIYENIRIGNRLYKWVLKAVALLGAELPAVTSLQDIINLYNTEFDVALSFKAGKEATEYRLADKEENNMELAALEKKYSESQARIVELETELKTVKENDIEKLKSEFKISETKCLKLSQDLEKSESDKNDAKDSLIKLSTKIKESEVSGRINELVNKGKLAPAQKELAFGLLMGSTKIKIGDKDLSHDEALFSLIENGSSVGLNTSIETSAGEANRNNNDENGREMLHNSALKYARENKVSYREALQEAIRISRESRHV